MCVCVCCFVLLMRVAHPIASTSFIINVANFDFQQSLVKRLYRIYFYTKHDLIPESGALVAQKKGNRALGQV